MKTVENADCREIKVGDTIYFKSPLTREGMQKGKVLGFILKKTKYTRSRIFYVQHRGVKAFPVFSNEVLGFDIGGQEK